MQTGDVIDSGAASYLIKLGGMEFLDRMIGLFDANPRRLLSEADVALAEGRIEAVERAGHSIKTSAAQMGAIHLREKALQLEKAAKTGAPSPELSALIASVRMAHEEACVAIRAWRSGVTS